MEENKVPTGLTVLLFCLMTFISSNLLRSCSPKPVKEEKEYSIKEYLEHPECYEVKKIYEDTNFIGYKVTYKK